MFCFYCLDNKVVPLPQINLQLTPHELLQKVLEYSVLNNVSCEEKYLTRVLSTVSFGSVHWDDIAGMQDVKRLLKELVVYPLLNPKLFQGIRSPGKGLLLFGPPGTGKTLIGKCLATEAKATFFSCTASTFASKWHGESEILVRSIFLCARALQPSIIFVDEVDSLLRLPSEFDSCAVRVKCEFLAQLDGFTSESAQEDQILFVGATNWPYKIDEAARRRFSKRVYIPLPDAESRRSMICATLGLGGGSRTVANNLDASAVQCIVDATDGYSCSDLKEVCRTAAMAPIHELTCIQTADVLDLRPINLGDVVEALQRTRPSVTPDALLELEKFNKEFGSC